MELPVLLKYVADALGLDSLELNEHGVLGLQFNDTIDVLVEPDPDGLRCHMYSPLCRAPDSVEQRLALFEAVLSANCFGRGSRGAAFSYDEQNRELLLGREFTLATTEPQQLQDWIRDLIEVMDVWQQRLPDILGEATPSASMDGATESEGDSPRYSHFIRP